MTGIKDEDKIVSEEHIERCDSFKQKVAGISEVLARNHMKVAFFGR